jgi:hypothetical protein
VRSARPAWLTRVRPPEYRQYAPLWRRSADMATLASNSVYAHPYSSAGAQFRARRIAAMRVIRCCGLNGLTM